MGSRVTVGGAKTAAGRGGTPYTTNSEKGQRGQRPERSEMPLKGNVEGLRMSVWLESASISDNAHQIASTKTMGWVGGVQS